MIPVRWSFVDELGEHEAQFTDTEEGELIAALAQLNADADVLIADRVVVNADAVRVYLDSLAMPAATPMQPLDPNSIGLAMIAGTGLTIAVISIAALVWGLL